MATSRREPHKSEDSTESPPVISPEDSTSLPESPPHPQPRRKRVDWRLPESASSPQLSRLNPQSPSLALGRQPTVEDELRDNIGQLFRNNPPHPQPTSIPQLFLSANNETHQRTPRKSALRTSSGASPAVTPPPERASDLTLNEGVSELEDKKKSLSAAQSKARQLSEQLDEDSNDGITIPSRAVSRSATGSETPSLSGRSSVDLYHDAPLQSGQVTPDDDVDNVPRPPRYRSTGLSVALSRAFGGLTSGLSSRRTSEDDIESRAATSQIEWNSSSTRKDGKWPRPPFTPRNSSFPDVFNLMKGKARKPGSNKLGDDVRIKRHIQETTVRQKYLMKLANALMSYGAPTHRLEEYMSMSARALDLEAQFWYIPGMMIMSFDDSQLHTTEVKMVKNNVGIDLGKLRDAHEIYKYVVHDFIGAHEAIDRLESIGKRKPKFNLLILILAHGVASASVGPFAFSARPIDLAPAFALGCLMGIFRVWVSPMSDLYSCVFETCATIALSFTSRALGSIMDPWDVYGEERLFCFAALTQSSIALILPGYAVLLGALELQSRSIIAGAVRLVYAIFLALLLGFSITIGTTIYGMLDENASSEPYCSESLPDGVQVAFVPFFTLALMVVNQAKYSQMPIMMFIAMTGHTVNYFSSKRFPRNASISSALAALTISFTANAYSRLGPKLDEPISKAMDWAQAKFKRVFDSSGMTELLRAREGDGGRPDSWGSLKYSDSEHASGASTPDTIELAKLPTKSNPHANTPPHGESSSSAETPEMQQEHTKQKRQIGSNYSLAAAAMLPGMFVLVPSGLSVAGSLVEGIQNAEMISKPAASAGSSETGQGHGGSNQGGQLTPGDVVSGSRALPQNNVGFQVGYNVVQVAIGITVGLYIGALFVYPFGKSGFGLKRKNRGMRSGLFSY